MGAGHGLSGAGVRVGARRTALPELCAAIALVLASCEDGASKHAGTGTSSFVSAPSAPLAAAPAASVGPQERRAEGPRLSAPGLEKLPRGFTPTFSHPDDQVEYRFDGGACSVFAHGRLGQAPVRAVVAAAGAVLTVKLELVGTSEKVVYRGELANTPCADQVTEDRGVLHAVKGVGRARHYPPKLFVSLERKRASPNSKFSSRMSLRGRAAADQAENTLDLSETKPFLLRAYDALAKPLFLHEGTPVNIEDAANDEKGTIVVAYRLPNRELKLAELRGARRVVRGSIKTGIVCVAPDCSSSVSGTRPRPGIALVVVTNTSWNCTPSCAATREVELWTLTARGFCSPVRFQRPASPRTQQKAKRRRACVGSTSMAARTSPCSSVGIRDRAKPRIRGFSPSTWGVNATPSTGASSGLRPTIRWSHREPFYSGSGDSAPNDSARCFSRH